MRSSPLSSRWCSVYARERFRCAWRGLTLLAAVLFTLSSNSLRAQSAINYAVELEVSVQSAPPQITLQWPADATALSFTVSRKAPEATVWSALATLPGSGNSFTDPNVAVGTAYEYQVMKTADTYKGYGYVQSGIQVRLTDTRGKVLLFVEASQAAPLAAELSRLEQDLVGDGWTVLRNDVARDATPASVKSIIKAAYTADPLNVKAVFLFGRVPVPYSGAAAPDGHPDHAGAWPADVFYGDIDGTWSDIATNYTQTANGDPAERARLTNIPGDGKFDPTYVPTSIELQVGRVDLSNMPGNINGTATFSSETELLRRYLEKDHRFRHRAVTVRSRAIVGDYFGAMGGQAFAASGFRGFAPLAGTAQVTDVNTQFGGAPGVWIPALAANDHLVAYGCGPGTYTSIGGIGSTTEIVGQNVRTVFALLCGSYFGDWDSQDNVMRAVLATPDYGLAAAWSGRPHWFIHPTALGETLGYVARLTQNNGAGIYRNQVNLSSGAIHVALMGDPTLRLLPVAPAAGLTGALSDTRATLSWSASADSVVGYHIYRGRSPAGPFTRLTTEPVQGNSFVDTSATSGLTYMVRAVKLQQTPSGSFFNASQGVFWSTGGVYLAPAAPVADTIAPVVAIASPVAGARLVGRAAQVSASATDETGVAGVQFKIDGVNVGGEMTSAPFATAWDTTLFRNGAHTLTVVARDAAGNRSTPAAVTVWIDNYIPDTTAPTVTISALLAGAIVEGTSVSLQAIATDNVATIGVLFQIDGIDAGDEVTATPFALTWDSTGVSNGLHTLRASARDAAGNVGFAEVSFTVNNPTVVATNAAGDAVWFDDALPAGATASGETWNWVVANPGSFSGAKAYQTAARAGLQEHSFNGAKQGLALAAGDTLFAYVYIDPVNPPAEIMLTWSADNTEHRAYWGTNKINAGKPGTSSRRSMGKIPAAGGWMLLEVPASDVGLEGQVVRGMTFSLYNGRATWDFVGKIGPRANARK